MVDGLEISGLRSCGDNLSVVALTFTALYLPLAAGLTMDLDVRGKKLIGWIKQKLVHP